MQLQFDEAGWLQQQRSNMNLLDAISFYSHNSGEWFNKCGNNKLPELCNIYTIQQET